jgi:hypothetical protein
MSVGGGQGEMLNTSAGSDFATLGPVLNTADVEGLVRFFTHPPAFNPGSSTAGILLRWSNTANHWLARVAGGNLQVMVKVNGSYSTVFSAPFAMNTGLPYWMRFQAYRNQIAIKVWQDGTAEPSAWTTIVTSSAQNVAGMAGLYGYDAGGNGTRFDTFSVDAVG